uniref:Anion exchange protein n=1 Tax=Lepeophtheirus salmonis TaxID=72036 RepID=A0A0K2VB20_LEPSM
MSESPSPAPSDNHYYSSEHISINDIPSIFSELLELVKYEDGYQEWKETARWIKYKENVEVEGNRWSKPHISTPSLQGWLRLRQSLRSGLTLIDLRAHSLREICEIVGDHIVSREDVNREEASRLQELWMKKHRHQFEGARKPDGKLTAVLKELLVQRLENKSNISGLRIPSRMSSRSGSRRCSITFPDDPVMDENYFSKPSVAEGKINYSLQKKISSNTEACIILVGVVSFLKKPVSVFIRLENAVILGDLPEVDITTRFIYICVGPQQIEKNGIDTSIILNDMGVSLATALSDKSFAKEVYECETVNDLLNIFDGYTNDLKTLPREWDSTFRIDPPPKTKTGKELDEIEEIDEDRRMREKSGLVRSGNFFGGLINDIKRKRPFYASDFIDGFHPQCISSFMFLYFACLTPIVAFGSLLGQATENRIATIESLMSGLICGVLFGLFSGQPLILLGSTGPVYVFEKILYTMCKDQDWDYLSFRLWIGIWVGAILIFLVAIDAGAYVCYITRFTEELFATLISFIFIFNAFKNLEKIRDKDYELLPPECTCLNRTDLEEKCILNDESYSVGCMAMESEVLLISILLFLGSFFISFTLKQIRNTGYFPGRVRDFLSNFAVVIAIGLMTGLDYMVGIKTPKLDVPSSFKPTWEGRDWIVTHALIFTDHLLSNPWWVDVFLAPVFAILATILIFMDQQITAVIVNKKENQLNKGGGYHLDMLVLAITIIICSVFGLPWFVAATVLSINHIQSLTKESESTAPGEKPQFLGIREQRVTHILIALCLGLSTLITPLLALIPMPVLFGIFLYMGVNSLKGLQFSDRLLLLFIPKKYQPDYIYLKYVPLGRVHAFTIVQLTALIGLWIIKNEPSTSISFPIMLVVICGIRKVLECFFTRRELMALDDLLPEGKQKRRHGGKESNQRNVWDDEYSSKSPKIRKKTRVSIELNDIVCKHPSGSSTVKKMKKMITHEKSHKVTPSNNIDSPSPSTSTTYPLVPFSPVVSKMYPDFKRTLIFVKLPEDKVHVPLHIQTPKVDDLIRNLHDLYPNTVPIVVSQRYKQNTKGIVFKLNDDLLEYISPNEVFEILIQHVDEDEEKELTLTLVEKDI